MKLVLTPPQWKLIRCMAALAHPAECSGFFLGWNGNRVNHVVPISAPFMATDAQFVYSTDSMHRAEQHYGEEVVGGYHSHPDARHSISELDKEVLMDYEFELIVSIWPGKRKEWCYGQRVYFNEDNKIRRGQVILEK